MASQETNRYLEWSIPVTAIVSVGATVAVMLYARSGATPNAAPSVPSLIRDTISYLPHILLLFGVLADMITYEGVYSIASLIGLLSIPMNYIFKFFWAGIFEASAGIQAIATGQAQPAAQPAAQAPANVAANVAAVVQAPVNAVANVAQAVVQGPAATSKLFENYNACEVQGFSFARSPYAPQTLVITATIFFYYIFDLINNRGWINTTATFVLFIVLYAAQIYVIKDCSEANDKLKSIWLKGLISLFEGLTFGGISYAIVQSQYPNSLPSSLVSPFPRKTRSNLKEGKEGTFVDESGNPYVCLSNGQCYPDMSSNESRKAFAEIASRNLGTGAAPVTTCPTS
jgi:hypothetical protein